MQDARSNVIPLYDVLPEHKLPEKEISIPNEAGINMKLNGGALEIPTEDGGVTIDFNPQATQRAKEKEFYDNLAESIDEGELVRISSELLESIESDEQSRSDWIETRTNGIELLGLKLENPGDVTANSAPLEGQSRVRHPLLLEAVLRFQANARGELLPASGPVKVRNDTPPRPDNPTPYMEPTSQTDDLADALECDMNHFLTVVAKEYVPDTDRMFFQVGFGGVGFKKIFNCPLRRRQAIDSVDPKDFIVNNSATSLATAGRITHRIMMRPSTLKRMQIVGAYRDILISPTSMPPKPNAIDEKEAELQGISLSPTRWQPEDVNQEILECYCELDIAGYEHRDDGKISGLRVPYKVTIHKESRQILEIRRNYLEHDELCMPKEYFVEYPFAPGFGFWPIGLLHILGNATKTLTAAWRLVLDAGMFASFPGFIYAKQAGRQLTNQFRVPPGGGVAMDVGMGRIQDMVMPLPYKDPGGALISFIERVEELSQRVGGTAELSVGEGNQEAPVGTTLALIEQASKAMDAVHKRMHDAQAREFQLLKERFKEDPEGFWRHNKRPRAQWQTDMFLQALERAELVPVADPNNPTGMHRTAKAAALGALAKEAPLLFDQMATMKRMLAAIQIDAEGILLPQAAPPPPDPKMEAVKAKAAVGSQQASAQVQAANLKAQEGMAKIQSTDRATQSKERIAQMQAEQDQMGGQADLVRKSQEMAMKQEAEQQKMKSQAERDRLKAEADRVKHQQNMQQAHQKNQMELQSEQQRIAMESHAQQQRQQMDMQGQERQMQLQEHTQNRQAQLDERQQNRKMEQDSVMQEHKNSLQKQGMEQKLEAQKETHQQKLQHGDEQNKAKVQQVKAVAAAKPKTKPKKGSK